MRVAVVEVARSAKSASRLPKVAEPMGPESFSSLGRRNWPPSVHSLEPLPPSIHVPRIAKQPAEMSKPLAPVEVAPVKKS